MVAIANAQPDSWSAEWYGTADPIASAPWLFDQGGNPIEVPAKAIGFRVRFVPPGSRGIGELTLDELTGIPLLVPRGLGPEEFCALVRYRPGRYRLAAIDEQYQFLRDAPIACFVITPAMAAAHNAVATSACAAAVPAPISHSDVLVLELVNALRAALTESRTALTESLGVIKAQTTDGARNVSELVRASATVVTAADGAGISRREPLPVVVPPMAAEQPTAAALGEDSGPTPPQNLGDVVSGALTNLAPVMQHFMNTKLFKMSDEMSIAMLKAMQGGAPANAAPATPTPSTAPASSTASAAAAINPAALWPHVAAIEQQLAPAEAAVVRRYIANAGGDQIAHLAREVMARSAPDAAAWIRAVLADVESTQPQHRAADSPASNAPTSQGPSR
jgi:hypothetical protein